MGAASLDHPAHAAMIPQGYGAGVGRVGDYYEQGNLFRGGVLQLLFMKWLYDTQHDIYRPRLQEGLEQQDLLRLQRFYDMAPEMPAVDWSETFYHLPLNDVMNYVGGSKGLWDEWVTRKPGNL